MTRAPVAIEDAARVLACWDTGAVTSLAPFGSGLINDTFAVDAASGRYVMQRVHPVFPPQVHDNIAAVTARVIARGLPSPQLMPTREGALWTIDGVDVWRVMTRVPGVSFGAVGSPTQAHAAAALLGRFHEALVDLPHVFVAMRQGVHDTPAHLRALASAVEGGRDHRLLAQVAPLAEAIAERADTLPALAGVPTRVLHGDPKFNNVLFAGSDGALAEQPVGLVDLDTVGPGALHLELGDMWRSWCNRRGEDERHAAYDATIYEASLAGYASARAAPDPDEREALVHGVEWITLELAARFAADALVERYFGWDATRFTTRGEHNLVRALGQWTLHEQVVGARHARAHALRGAW